MGLNILLALRDVTSEVMHHSLPSLRICTIDDDGDVSLSGRRRNKKRRRRRGEARRQRLSGSCIQAFKGFMVCGSIGIWRNLYSVESAFIRVT